jgi:PAS domain S-box-containing protein
LHTPHSSTAPDLMVPSDYDAVPVGLCVLSHDLRFLRINETMAQFNGYSPAEHVGRRVSEVVPDLEPVARTLMNQIVETGKPVGPFEVAGETPADPGSRRFWMEIWSPVTDERGHIVGASVAALEITERKRLEREKDKALKQQTAIAEIGQLALQDVAFQVVLDKVVEAAAAALDVPLTKILAFGDSAENLKLVAGLGWEDGLVGTATVGIDRDSQAGYTLQSGELVVVEDLATETRFTGPALLKKSGVVSGMSVTISGPEARPFGVIGIHTTERRSFDKGDRDFLLSLATIISNAVRKEDLKAQSNLLIREMSHRAGNMLQLVSSIATQTFRHSHDPDVAREAFNQRLSSLARANHAVAQQGWVSSRLQLVVEQTLSPFADKIRMLGRDVLLPPELCFDIGLVLNEICTNAVKYGSLGTDDGLVTLTWKVEGSADMSVLKVEWNDTKPAVASDTTFPSTGFGSKLMQQLVTKKWHGTIDVSRDDGYRINITLPMIAGNDRRLL